MRQRTLSFRNTLNSLKNKIKNLSLYEIENNNTIRNKVLNEGLKIFSKDINKFQRNIDELTIDADHVEDYEDKYYIIDKLYKYMSELDSVLGEMSSDFAKDTNPDYARLKSYKSQLEAIRTSVMVKKVSEKKYGVFVKYPVNYEG